MDYQLLILLSLGGSITWSPLEDTGKKLVCGPAKDYSRQS